MAAFTYGTNSILHKKARDASYKNILVTVLCFFLVIVELNHVFYVASGEAKFDLYDIGYSLVFLYLSGKRTIKGTGGIYHVLKGGLDKSIYDELKIYNDNPDAELQQLNSDLEDIKRSLKRIVVTPRHVINFSCVGVFEHSIMPIYSIKYINFKISNDSNRYQNIDAIAIDEFGNEMVIYNIYERRKNQRAFDAEWNRLDILIKSITLHNDKIMVQQNTIPELSKQWDKFE